MYVAYFDEVKNDANASRNRYLVGGLVVSMDKIGAIEEQVSNLASEIFGNRELTPDTEFHGDYIYRAKGPFRGMTMGDRAISVRPPGRHHLRGRFDDEGLCLDRHHQALQC